MTDYYTPSGSTLASCSPVRLPCNAFRTAGTPAVSAGFHRISPVRGSPAYVPQQRNSEYSRAYGVDFGEARKRRNVIKRLRAIHPHQPLVSLEVAKAEREEKVINSIKDSLADRLSLGSRKSSIQYQSPLLDISPKDMRPLGAARAKYPKHFSRGNTQWLIAQAKASLLRKFSAGELVPSIDQLCLYARRATPSRFCEKRLWEGGSLQSIGT